MPLRDAWRTPWPTTLLVAPPTAFVLGAYVWMAIDHGTPLLWNVLVHESGHYTLGQTILFFRHFLREVPVDVAMGLACAAAVPSSSGTRAKPGWPAALAAVALVSIAFALSTMEEGWREALRDLLQYRTRDDDVAYGSHWSFHLLSTIWIGAAAAWLGGLTSGAGGIARPSGRARGLVAASWGWIGVLTLAFGVMPEVFTSARYIGHQAREIMTHALITLPLVTALLRTGRAEPAPPKRAGIIAQLLLVVPVAVIPLFLVVAFGRADLSGTAQMTSGLSGVVAAHVFEHVLDYVLVALVAIAAAPAVRRPGAA